MKTYKDILGNELKVKFSVGGFDNDITCCSLYKQTMIFPGIKFLGIKPRYDWKKVYLGITTDNLETVSKWISYDWDSLARKCINEYNSKHAIRRMVKNMAKMNSNII